MTALALPGLLAQGIVDLLPDAVLLPGAIVMEHDVARPGGIRQAAPVRRMYQYIMGGMIH